MDFSKVIAIIRPDALEAIEAKHLITENIIK